jgi:hypothetical protein
MSTSDIPVILLLLLPGFLAVQVFNLVSHKRVLSDLERLLWGLIISFVLLAPTATIWHKVDDAYPSFREMVTNPKESPMRVVVLLYILAIPAGWVLGYIDRCRWLEDKLGSPLQRVGIDLRRRHDVWHLAFRDSYYVIVHLKSGCKLHGFPEKTETNRQGSVADVYLVEARFWDEKREEWTDLQDIEGVWIDASNIERIDFTTKPSDKPLAAHDA